MTLTNTPHCLVFDFDHTLSHFIHGYDGLFTIFTHRGIPAETVSEAYRRIKKAGGFSLAAYIAHLQQMAGTIPHEDTVAQEFEDWLKNSIELYPDVLPCLTRWRKDIPIEILTFGDPEFQRKKINMTGLGSYPLHIVASQQQKARELTKIIARYGTPVVFVDDIPSVLDEIRHRFPPLHVITILIIRPDTIQPPGFNPRGWRSHHVISSLSDLTWRS